jgi:hypothetical protein
VRKAVDDYFADDATANAARAQLEAWGDAALPFLRSLAGEPSAFGAAGDLLGVADDWHLVCAIGHIDTPGAIDLLIDVMDGTTGIVAMQGLNGLSTATRTHAERLRADHRFKKIVFRFTLSRGTFSSIERSTAADIIAEMQWEEGEEVLEAMCHDSDAHVARRAAGALFELTGRTVELPHAALEFPAMGEELPPLGEPLVTESVRGLRGRFTTWRDGSPALVQAHEGMLMRAGVASDLAPARWELPWSVADMLSVTNEAGEDRWLVAIAENSFGNSASALACMDREGRELWQWKPKRATDLPMTALYDARGVIGVAVGPGGDDGVVALDLDGKTLCSSWSPVLYELDSHPALPDRLVICGGDLTVHDNTGRILTSTRAALFGGRLGFFYASHVQLFPDADGQLALIASGNALNSDEILVRLDAALQPVWRASLPAEVEGLATLERDGRPRLFAAALADGQLLVFDEDGGLRAPLRIAERPNPGDRASVYAMDAGLLHDGSRALLIDLLRETLIFPYR